MNAGPLTLFGGAGALALVGLDALLRALRLRALLPSGKRPSLWRAALVNAWGEAAAAVTPARMGGEPARFALLRREGTASPHALGALAAEMALGWIAIATAFLALALTVPEAGLHLARRTGTILGAPGTRPWLLAAATLLGVCGALARRHRIRGPLPPSPLAADTLNALARTPRPALLWAAALTAASLAARVAILPLLLSGAENVPAAEAIIASFLLLHGQLVLPSPSGVGAVELGFAAGFRNVLSPADLASCIVLWRLFTLVPGIALLTVAAAVRSCRAPAGAARQAGSRTPRPPLQAAVAKAAPPLLLLALAAPAPLSAQNAVMGSRQLPVEHPAYEYLWRLQARGYLGELNPLVQPYRRLDVARSLAALDPDSLGEPTSRWVRWLRREFARELERLTLQDAGSAASTSETLHGRPTSEGRERHLTPQDAGSASSTPETLHGRPTSEGRERGSEFPVPPASAPKARAASAEPQPSGPQGRGTSSHPTTHTPNPALAGLNPLSANLQPADPQATDPQTGNPSPASLGVELHPGVRASTSKRLDPLRPVGSAGLWPRYALDAWIESGSLVLATGLTGDIFFWDDPDGLNPDQRRGGRPDNAYLAVALPFGEILLGRFRRNWGPQGAPGLMISQLATSYPQIGLEARVGRFVLRSFTGELDTIRGEKRYIAAHRVDYESPNLVISFGESILYAGGPGAPSLRYANPLAFLFFENGKRPDREENLTLDAQVWYRQAGTSLYGEFLLDDFEILDPPEDREPLQYAFTAGLRVTSLASSLELEIEYRQVGAWTYRTVAGIDRYVYLRRGLGENYVDFDRLTLSLDFFPAVQGLTISPLLQLQREGVQDLRGPDLVGFRWEDSTAVFTGQTQTTLRTALRGRYSPSPNFCIEWDAGWNTTRNAGHVAGRSRSAFEATAALGITLPFRPPQPHRTPQRLPRPSESR